MNKLTQILHRNGKVLLEEVEYDTEGCAQLQGKDLTGASLTGADLEDASLTDAILRDANLTGANLRSADLEGAIL